MGFRPRRNVVHMAFVDHNEMGRRESCRDLLLYRLLDGRHRHFPFPPAGRVTALMGRNGSGKSSLLWYISQPQIYSSRLKGAERYVFIFIDFQGLRQLDQEGFCRIFGEYLAEVVAQLRFLARSDALSAHEKFAFFHETRHAFGRSALMLSGGASLGLYHVGVILTLRSLNLLPKIVCGSSVGAIIGAILCCKRDEELDTLLEPGARGGQHLGRLAPRHYSQPAARRQRAELELLVMDTKGSSKSSARAAAADSDEEPHAGGRKGRKKGKKAKK